MQFKWLFAAIALGAGAAQAQMPPAAPTPPALSGEWVVDLSSRTRQALHPPDGPRFGGERRRHGIVLRV